MAAPSLGPVPPSGRSLTRREFLKLATAAGAAAMGAPLLAQAPSLLQAPAVRAQESITVVELVDTLQDEYFVTSTAIAKQAGEALGIKVEVVSFELSLEKQVAETENAFTRGAKAIRTNAPGGGASLNGVMEKAREKGGLVLVQWDLLPWTTPLTWGDEFAMFSIAADDIGGYNTAKALFEALGGKGNVLHITGFPGGTNDAQRTYGFDQALKEYPGITLLDRQPGKWAREPANALMRDWLIKYPQIDGVFAQADASAMGALAAIEEAGRTGITVVSLNGVKEAVEAVRDGRLLCTSSILPHWNAGWNMVRLFDQIKGWKPTIPERFMVWEPVLVTRDIAQAYLDTIIDAPKPPYDWLKMSRVLHPEDWEVQELLIPENPRTFWQKFSGKPEPADWLHPDFQRAIDSGELQRVAQLYAEHEGNNPVKALKRG